MPSIVPSMRPVFEPSPNIPRKRARCPACQLQICKSRSQSAHAALKEVERDQAGNSAVYCCDACGVSLVWSGDPGLPGWSQRRDASAA